MKLKKAGAWYHNRSNRDIVIDELGIKIKKGSVVDLFKANPYLQYDRYLSSMRTGVLAQKSKDLVALADKPERQEPFTTVFEVSSVPRISLSKSSIVVGSDGRDWIDTLEEEFPAGAQPLSQEEAWNIERKKAAKVLQNLETADTGDNGEVFSDIDFDISEEGDTDF